MSAKNQILRFATVEDVIEELEPGYPVYCLRPAELKRQAGYFLDTFPGRVMYAVKCNPQLAVLPRSTRISPSSGRPVTIWISCHPRFTYQ